MNLRAIAAKSDTFAACICTVLFFLIFWGFFGLLSVLLIDGIFNFPSFGNVPMIQGCIMGTLGTFGALSLLKPMGLVPSKFLKIPPAPPGPTPPSADILEFRRRT